MEKVKQLVGKVHSKFLTLLWEKEQRENRRIKAIEIARATNLTPTTVGNWMRDDVTKFDAHVLEAFCAYFDCNIGDLLDIVPESPANDASN